MFMLASKSHSLQVNEVRFLNLDSPIKFSNFTSLALHLSISRVVNWVKQEIDENSNTADLCFL